MKLLGALLLLAAVAASCATNGSAPASPGTAATATTTAPTAPPTSSLVPRAGTPPSTIPSAPTAAPTTVVPTTTSPVEVVPSDEDAGHDDAFEVDHGEVDRTHPFQPLERFCTTSTDPDEGPEETDRGISGESVTIVHLRTRLEELAMVGVTVDVGDTAAMFEAFTALINDGCGGIHGRRLDLRLVEVSALGGAGVDIDTLRTVACIEATEQIPAVVVVSSTGLQGRMADCLTVGHDVAFLTAQGQPEDLLRKAGGLLRSTSLASETAMRLAVRMAHDGGHLDGRFIAVVAPDSPGDMDSVEEGLLESLRDLGYDPVFHLIGCEGTTTCRVGREVVVDRMIAAGTDVVFPALNIVSLPGLIGEMAARGMPKPVILQSGFNGQSDNLAAGRVAAYSGVEAGRYYDGTLIVDSAQAGGADNPEFTPSPFDGMCNAEFMGMGGDSYDPGSAAYAMVTSVCTLMRMTARAVFDAGPDPRRRDVHHALQHLGPVDMGGMVPASTGHDNYVVPDAVRFMEYRYPCRRGSVADSPAAEDTGCVVATSDFMPLG